MISQKAEIQKVMLRIGILKQILCVTTVSLKEDQRSISLALPSGIYATSACPDHLGLPLQISLGNASHVRQPTLQVTG